MSLSNTKEACRTVTVVPSAGGQPAVLRAPVDLDAMMAQIEGMFDDMLVRIDAWIEAGRPQLDRDAP